MGFSAVVDYDLIKENVADLAAAFNWNAVENLFCATNLAPVIATLASDILGRHLESDDDTEAASLGTMYIPKAGTYTVEVLCNDGSNVGIIGIRIDGAADVDIDPYNAGGASYNQLHTASLGTLTRGLHDVNVRVHGKNAGASDHYMYLQAISIYKT